MPVLNRISDFHQDMTAWRRDFHRHPELGFAESRTANIIAEHLRSFGLDEVVTGVGRTGVVGVIRGATNDNTGSGHERAIGLRADMDALPIREETGLPWASTTPGVMHACGHDGHSAMLLGAARYLAETRNFAGSVYIVFQPAEETGQGAAAMLREGRLLERFPFDHVFGLHNWPGLPEGQFAWREGPMMAAAAQFSIDVRGQGTHGAAPHLGKDAVLAAAQIVCALQGIIARDLDPLETAVISVGDMRCDGGAWNVIPGRVTLEGTARWFTPAAGMILERRIGEVAEGTATTLGASADVFLRVAGPPVANDPDATRLAAEVARTVVGDGGVAELAQPTMVAEDFGHLLQKRPGCFLLLGAGRGRAQEPQLHQPGYDFNDALLPIGASWFAKLAERLLPRT
jgi:hippurate hydrolase